MSTHKHFDKICCVVLVLTLLLTVFFINGEKFGIQKASTVMGYETAVFDNSRVHTIEIIMDNWDEFLESCKSEEYYNCSVVIDNEAYKNVAIRGKGNTSLSSVDSYGNNRYSFKIEFDHYDNTSTYHGLDKLVLNNVIQDNTYMKDYLTYQMMNDMGVAAPLCSYVYITVNGEDWGLYLAVEGVEESFLQRNYGKDYGELYKPDSMSMGGGRGNGMDFNMENFMSNEESQNATTTTPPEQQDSVTEETTSDTSIKEEATTAPGLGDNPFGGQMPEGMTPPDMGSNPFGGQMPEGMTPPDMGNNPFGGQMPEGMTPPDMGSNPFGGQMPEGMTPPDMGSNPFGGQMPEGITPPDMGTGTSALSGISAGSSSSVQTAQLSNSSSFAPASGFDMPSMGGMDSFNFDIDEEAVRNAFIKLGLDESLLEEIDFESISITDVISLMSKLDEDTVQKLMQEIMGGSASGMPSTGGDFSFDFSDAIPGGFGGMGSSDVKLQYIDDNADSYSNIFSSAKTDITNADKNRLIEALRRLSAGEELENTVAVEEVMRYFVVHNFVVNSDSYTGSMIHNYYLYEKDGQLQMIPWDYNLAFGTFMSTGSATSSVNDPIDTPLSVSGNGDRPMIDWIFGSEEYTELYHQYFSEFISEYFDSGYFENLIDSTISMISPYVEKDPTKFCTYEEFLKGSETLKAFCLLRAQSVKGQLNGNIGATASTQISDTLIDASGLNTSDMGSMGGMGGKGGMSFPAENTQKPQNSSDSKNDDSVESDNPSTSTDNSEGNGSNAGSRPQRPDNFSGGSMPDFSGENNPFQNGQMQMPDSSFRPGNAQSQFGSQGLSSASSLIMLFVSVILLAAALVFASKYKRRG